jgi:hypothetical protein
LRLSSLDCARDDNVKIGDKLKSAQAKVKSGAAKRTAREWQKEVRAMKVRLQSIQTANPSHDIFPTAAS